MPAPDERFSRKAITQSVDSELTVDAAMHMQAGVSRPEEDRLAIGEFEGGRSSTVAPRFRSGARSSGFSYQQPKRRSAGDAGTGDQSDSGWPQTPAVSALQA
jgi:hypothetical protein